MTTLEIAWVLTFPVAVVLALPLLGRGPRSRALLLIAVAVAVFGLAGDLGMILRQRDVAAWERVDAKVVTSERGRRANAWEFEYEYTVAGVTHRASRFTYRPRLRGRGDTDFLAERYSEGAPFSAWVDPDDATRAVVDPRPSYGLPAAGIALHGGLLALAWRARQDRP